MNDGQLRRFDKLFRRYKRGIKFRRSFYGNPEGPDATGLVFQRHSLLDTPLSDSTIRKYSTFFTGKGKKKGKNLCF